MTQTFRSRDDALGLIELLEDNEQWLNTSCDPFPEAHTMHDVNRFVELLPAKMNHCVLIRSNCRWRQTRHYEVCRTIQTTLIPVSIDCSSRSPNGGDEIHECSWALLWSDAVLQPWSNERHLRDEISDLLLLLFHFDRQRLYLILKLIYQGLVNAVFCSCSLLSALSSNWLMSRRSSLWLSAY